MRAMFRLEAGGKQWNCIAEPPQTLVDQGGGPKLRLHRTLRAPSLVSLRAGKGRETARSRPPHDATSPVEMTSSNAGTIFPAERPQQPSAPGGAVEAHAQQEGPPPPPRRRLLAQARRRRDATPAPSPPRRGPHLPRLRLPHRRLQRRRCPPPSRTRSCRRPRSSFS